MAQVETLKIGNTSYGITDANTLPALTAAQRSQLLLNGTYLGSAVESGKVFETVNGTFESFTKTAGDPTITITSTTMPTTADWRAVTSNGNGRFVAVSPDGYSAYSTDGTNWTSGGTLSTYAAARGIAYGNGKFVTVSYGYNTACYSTDGTSWTAATLPVSSGWRSIVYGNDKFVAVSEGGYAAYSADGISWLSSSTPSSEQWRSVTYGDGKFVAVANDSSTAVYSTDGFNWSSASLPATANWRSVTYGNGKFVAVGTNATAYSTDGTNWTLGSGMSNIEYSSVAYCDGFFIAVGWDSSSYIYSPDGVTWTSGQLPDFTYWVSVAYSNGHFVAVCAVNKSTAAVGTVTTSYTYSLSPVKNYVENTATRDTSIAIGTGTVSSYHFSVAMGNGADSKSQGTAIGYGTTALPNAVAIGMSARASATYAAQIGTGNNTTEGTLQFRSYPLVDASGNIPADRMSSVLTSKFQQVSALPEEPVAGTWYAIPEES